MRDPATGLGLVPHGEVCAFCGAPYPDSGGICDGCYAERWAPDETAAPRLRVVEVEPAA